MICPVEIAHEMSALRAARIEEHASMDSYPKAAMERAMKVQGVMLQAVAKMITWWQAAEIAFRSRVYLARRKSFLPEHRRIFPRFLRIAPALCHSLIKRLVVWGVIFAAAANSSLVTSRAMPPATF